jgi:hypothetical protein
MFEESGWTKVAIIFFIAVAVVAYQFIEKGCHIG